MNECGKVIKIKRNNATVSFDRKSACESCRMCAASKSGKTVEVTVENVLNAEIGDTVEVTMGSKYVLTAAVIVYVIPLILVTIAVFAFKPLGEIAQLIATFGALIIGFAVAIVLDRKVIRKKKGFVPEMTKLVMKKDTEEKLIEAEKKYSAAEDNNAPSEDNENSENKDDGGAI